MNTDAQMMSQNKREEMNSHTRVEMLSGPLDGLLFELTKQSIVIGRGDDADISLPDLAASRRHARISYTDGQYWIEDLNSRNGTFINADSRNGKAVGAWKITRAKLPYGTIFRVGMSEMRLTRTGPGTDRKV